jgi:hypothetical protein
MGNQVGGPLGGLWINEGTVDIENSTFVDNQPSGLDVEGGASTARNVTFVGSRPAGVSVTNSLFVDTTCNDPLNGSDNLQWPRAAPCVTGIGFGDPQAGTVGDNGGPTPTVLPAGAAVEGVGMDCPDTDQRGEPRDTSSCAAGAVEP